MPAEGKRHRGRAGRTIARGLTALLLLLVLCPAVLAPLRNDLAADRLLEEFLAELELPPGAVVEETAAWVGNSSGTGNHVELWAGVLVRYAGPEETAPGQPAESWEDWACTYAYPAFLRPEALFPSLAELEDWSGRRILGTFGEAVSQWDLRGH